MKVRFVGLSLKAGDGISLNDFFKYLQSQNGITIEFNNYNRYCYITDISDVNYNVGLLLTIKDQKKFCELQNIEGNFKVSVTSIAEHSDLMDFNFFVINKNSGMCMFQHYHNSCSANQFGYFLNQRFIFLQEKNIQEEKNKKPNLSKKEKLLINKKYKKSLTWELMVRPEKIDDILKELDTIQTFEIDFSFLEAENSKFSPMSKYVTKERKRFSFMQKTPASELTPVFQSIISSLGIKKGRFFGKDIDGIQKIINISENPDNFGEYDYDYVADKLDSLDLNEFHNNWVVKELLNKTQEYKYIFEAEIKDEN